MTLFSDVATTHPTSLAGTQGATRIEYEAVAHELIARWRSGEVADAAKVLMQSPELVKFRSVAIDLAYEEYCLKTAAGAEIDTNSFCARFPEIRRSLQQQIELHQLIEGSPDLLERCVETYWPREHDLFLGFEIIEEIGRGAFAHVYRAREVDLGNRQVVVKVSTVHGADEASILGRLEHPNIVSLHSIQHDAERRLSAICMPYLGEATLGDVLTCRKQRDMNRLEELLGHASTSSLTKISFARWYRDRVIEIVVGVTSGLEFAHSQGILHLDIKPSNVLLTRDGVPKLLDFNLAHDEQRSLNRTGGTVPYMSPEQLLNLQGTCTTSLGTQSDIFSVGVLLYELLTGRLPFNSSHDGCATESDIRRLLEQQHKGILFLKDEQEELGAHVIHVLHDALNCSIERRITSAFELRSRLIELLDRPRTVARRQLLNSSLAFASGGGVLAAIGALGFVPWTPSNEILDRQTERKVMSGDIRSAIDDLRSAVSNRPTFRKFALLGFCCAKVREHRDACHWNRVAVTTDSRYATVWNNLGYSLYKLGQVEEARTALREAANISPVLQPARHNRAILEYFVSINSRTLPVCAIQEIDAAVRLGEPCTELYRDAALIYASAATYDNRFANDAHKYFRLAVEFGANCNSLAQHECLKSLIEQAPDLQTLKAATHRVTTRARLIVEPPELFTM